MKKCSFTKWAKTTSLVGDKVMNMLMQCWLELKSNKSIKMHNLFKTAVSLTVKFIEIVPQRYKYKFVQRYKLFIIA